MLVSFVILVNSLLDSLNRVKNITDRSVMIKCIDKKSDILTHINIDIPRLVVRMWSIIPFS